MKTPVAHDQRRAYRADVRIPVAYVVEGQAEAHAAVARNVSAGGMRLVADEALVADRVVHVRFALPNDLVRGVRFEREVEERTLRGRFRKRLAVTPPPFAEMTLPVKLVSTQRDVQHDKAISGVRFVDLDAAVSEELHRFVHVLQLNVLRERANSRRYYRELNGAARR